MVSLFQNNPNYAAQSHQTDLELNECFWKGKPSSYNQRNTLTRLSFHLLRDHKVCALVCSSQYNVLCFSRVPLYWELQTKAHTSWWMILFHVMSTFVPLYMLEYLLEGFVRPLIPINIRRSVMLKLWRNSLITWIKLYYFPQQQFPCHSSGTWPRPDVPAADCVWNLSYFWKWPWSETGRTQWFEYGHLLPDR